MVGFWSQNYNWYGRKSLLISKVKHMESRCNFRNKDVPCRAWYLIVSSQSAFELDYLVDMVNEVELYAAGFETCAKKLNRYLPTIGSCCNAHLQSWHLCWRELAFPWSAEWPFPQLSFIHSLTVFEVLGSSKAPKFLRCSPINGTLGGPLIWAK